MKTRISVKEAVAIIQRNVKGTMAISVDTVTIPKLRKTGNPYADKIQKACTINGLIGFDYENAVNNQAKREGVDANREAKPRQWGELTPDRIFVTHKGEYYLQLKAQTSSDPIYSTFDGEIVPVETLRPFIAEKAKSSTQDGIEKEIVIRDIKMINIIGMRFCGSDYEIVQTVQTEETAAPVLTPPELVEA
jgi:hypothetical protein